RASTIGRTRAAAFSPRTAPSCWVTSSPRAVRRPSAINYPEGPLWRGGRAVECGGLENRYGGFFLHRGFESLPLRSEPNPVIRGERAIAIAASAGCVAART